MISELSMTLLPEPVEPAMSRWGMLSSSATADAAADVLAEARW